MKYTVAFPLLILALQFQQQSYGSEDHPKTAGNIISTKRLRHTDTDPFVQSFFSQASPLFGILQKRPQGDIVIDIFNWAKSPSALAEAAFITYDGKLRGKVDVPKKMNRSHIARQGFIAKLSPLPKTKPLPDSLGGDVFVLTSDSQFRDPAKWTVKVPNESVQNDGRKTISEYLELMACKTSGKKPRPSPMIRMNDPSVLKFVKSYSNVDGEFVLGFSVDKTKVKMPNEFDWCGEYTDEGDEDTRVFLEVQARAIFWAFQSTKRNSVFIGRGVPIDAGDYNGDGLSEFVFFETIDTISSHHVGDLKVFSPDFRKYLSLEIGRP